jgi:eukaryotic-like serine/threonine-protein kinase
MTSPDRIAAGVRLGRYEIVAFVDAGGMGEVYRAHDLELERPVAIKVLPAAVVERTDRLHRFELEARATAALNHPNVLAVYDVGRHQGAPYLVTEWLDGQTLRARLDGATVPLRDAISFGSADRRRAGRGARPRRGTSRHQARERLHHHRRAHQGPGLRSRQAARP